MVLVYSKYYTKKEQYESKNNIFLAVSKQKGCYEYAGSGLTDDICHTVGAIIWKKRNIDVCQVRLVITVRNLHTS